MTDFSLDDEFVVAHRGRASASRPTPAPTSGEVWAGPTTPLTSTSMSGWPFEDAWREALARVGAFDVDEFDPDHQEMVGVFYGYIYLNLSVQRVFGVRMPGASADIIDASFFGGGSDDVPALRARSPRREPGAHRTDARDDRAGRSASTRSPSSTSSASEVARAAGDASGLRRP